jgi:hypothetical protein
MALALNPDGEKDVLGLWIEQSEGAKVGFGCWVGDRLMERSPTIRITRIMRTRWQGLAGAQR